MTRHKVPKPDDVKARLRELAVSLREADHLEPATQRSLAALMEELASSLGPATSSAHDAVLADHAAQLAHALHERHDEGVLASAKRRLEESALRAESEAPVTTGVVRRLLDALANLGI